MKETTAVCAIVPNAQTGFGPHVFGMGIIVGDREVLTCAHVVESAMSFNRPDPAHPRRVRLCFPFANDACINGTVDESRWYPVGEGELSDVAVILLDHDAPAKAGRAVFKRPKFRNEISAFGCKQRKIGPDTWESHPDGMHAHGQHAGEQGHGRGQFDGLRGGAPVEKGYSGAGVYDYQLKACVGMVVELDSETDLRIAQFFTSEYLCRALGRAAPTDIEEFQPDARWQQLRDVLVEISVQQGPDFASALWPDTQGNPSGLPSLEKIDHFLKAAQRHPALHFFRLLGCLNHNRLTPLATARLYTSLDNVCIRIVTWRHMSELRSQLLQKNNFRQLDKTKLDRLWRRAVAAWPGSNPGMEPLEDCAQDCSQQMLERLNHLASAPYEPQGTQLPLINFLHETKSDLGLSLREVREWAQKLNASLPPPASRAQVPTPETTEINLLRLFIPESGIDERYALTAQLIRGPGEEPENVIEAPSNLKREELEPWVIKAIQSAMRALDGEALTEIEVFLPIKLMLEPLEEIATQTPRGQPWKIGDRWPLVIRSMERLTDDKSGFIDYRGIWRTKWNSLADQHATNSSIPWVCSQWPTNTTLFNYFNASPPLGAKIIWPLPDPREEVCLESFVEAFLVGGVPVTVFVRHPHSSADIAAIREKLDASLTSHTIENWPRIIHEVRKQLQREFQGITLYYDKPPTQSLNAKSVGKMSVNTY